MHFTSVINRNWYPYANPENFVSNPVTTVIYGIVNRNGADMQIGICARIGHVEG